MYCRSKRRCTKILGARALWKAKEQNKMYKDSGSKSLVPKKGAKDEEQRFRSKRFA